MRLPTMIAMTAFLGGATAAGGEPPRQVAGQVSEQLSGEIANLAHADYAVREAATETLLRLGGDALNAVEAAARSPDPELRARAARLAVLLRQRWFEQRLAAFVRGVPLGDARANGGPLEGWREFAAIVGPGASRRVYANAYRADAELLVAAFGPVVDPLAGPVANAAAPDREAASRAGQRQPTATMSRLLESRIAGLRGSHSVNDPAPPGHREDPVSGLVAVQLVAAARSDLLTPRATQQLIQLARADAAPLAKGDGALARSMRRLLCGWIVSSNTEDLYALSQMLKTADELDLRGVTPLALAIASGKRAVRPAHPQFRATALLMVGKLGGVADIERLRPLLTDQAVCTSQAGRGGRHAALLDVEVRDVALAVMLHLSGEEPGAFGFDHAAEHTDRLFVLHTLAFASDAERSAAMARWRAFEPSVRGPQAVAVRPGARLR